MKIASFETEGVLIIANTTKIKSYYQDKEFDYSYPEGLSDLILKGMIHVITTDETAENLNFIYDESLIDLNRWEYNESYNYLKVEEGDEIRLVSHATFTQMCDSYKGDLNAHIENSVQIHNILNPDFKIDQERLYLENPKIDLSVGINRVNVYTNTVAGQNFLPEFTFLFELVDSIDLSQVTLEPIDFEG